MTIGRGGDGAHRSAARYAIESPATKAGFFTLGLVEGTQWQGPT